MSIEILPTLPTGSPEWHEQRRHRIGGSEIAAVLGLSPWESPFSLWHRKAGNVPPPDLDGEPVVHWGHMLEPVVRDEWMVRHRGTHYVRPELGLTVADGVAIASPDAVVSRRGRGYSLDREVLEVKTSAYADKWIDGPPVHYLAQVQWYMGALALPRAHFAVLIGGSDFREYSVDFDPDDYAYMRTAATGFVESIAAGQAPPIDGAYVTYETVRALHSGIDRGESVEVPDDLADELLYAKAEKDVVDRNYRAASSRVLDLMGTAQHACRPDGSRVAYRMARGDSTPFLVADKAALAPYRSAHRAA